VFQNFDAKLVAFLKALSRNNDKKWFQANKDRFAAEVQDPMLAFVEALEPRIRRVSKHILVEAKKSGGSISRIFRDTRFSKDKNPYHTHVAAIFRHEVGKKAPAPGFFFRVDTKEVTLGTGIWQPEGPALLRIRKAIANDPGKWKKASRSAKFTKRYPKLAGESLKRPPQGFDPEHELISDLKRKDFVAFCQLPLKQLQSKKILDEVEAAYSVSKPFVKFLCDALKLKF